MNIDIKYIIQATGDMSSEGKEIAMNLLYQSVQLSEANKQAARDEDRGEWIVHDGGDMPVQYADEVQVYIAGTGSGDACKFNWEENSYEPHVLKYRYLFPEDHDED